MKTTEIPNGYVVQGDSGKNLLVDFDDQGKASEDATEISISGWTGCISDGGLIYPDLIVLVHTVKGESGMLIRRLSIHRLTIGEKKTTVAQVARMGKLNGTAEQVWRDYMADRKHKEDLATQIEESKKT